MIRILLLLLWLGGHVLTGGCCCCFSNCEPVQRGRYWAWTRRSENRRVCSRGRGTSPTTTTTTTTTTAVASTKTQLRALFPLSVDQAERLLALGAPTGAQYATYWGRTARERYGRLLESSIVSFLGVFFSYFLSFVLGGFPATILGTLFVFWGILSPEFQAYQRNWEFLGGRPLVEVKQYGGDDDNNHYPPYGWMSSPFPRDTTEGLYAALFLGCIRDLCVVEEDASLSSETSVEDIVEYDLMDFDDYTMETDELEKLTGHPYLLRIQCVDRNGRSLQVHTRMSEEYTGGALQVGMPVTALLLSTRRDFTRLAALTEVYIPEANLWVGDYPYLDREEMETLLAMDDELWDALQDEAVVLKSSLSSSPPLAATRPRTTQEDTNKRRTEQNQSPDIYSSGETDNDYDDYDRWGTTTTR